MDEYIKRSEVIDLVEKAIKKCSTEKTTKGVLVCAHLRTAVMGLRSTDVAPRSEWISVEERLPLNFESVLVLATSRREDDGYDVLIAYHDHGEWQERCVHGDGNTVYAHVKYWMPLPEPPKAKKPKAKQPKDSENYEKKRLLPGDCFHGEIWCRCPYCLTGIEAHSIPKDRICHNCGKEYL